MENIGSFTRSGVKYFILRYGLGFLINFTGTVVIARKGGPELWGIFAVSQLVLTIFAFLSLGCWGYLIQNPKEPSREEIGNCYCFQTLGSILWAVVVIIMSPLLSSYLSSEKLTPLLLGTVLGGIFYGWRFIACGLSERNLQYRVAAISELSDIFVFNIVAVSLSIMGYTYYGILIGNIFRGIVSAIVAHIGSRQRVVINFDRAIIKRIISFSIPFSGYNILQWLPVNAGPVVAGTFLGLRELGLLQLSYKIMEYPRVLVTIAFRLSMSIFSRIGKSTTEIQRGAEKAIDILFFLLVPGMGLIVAFSPIWIPFVYGAIWSKMSDVMVIIVFPFLTMAMLTVLSSLLSSQGRVKAPSIFFCIYNCIYWPALIILTKKVGYFGLPITEWIVLISCAVLLIELKMVGIHPKIVLKKLVTLLVVALIVILIWWLALNRSFLEIILLSIIVLFFWFKISPVNKEAMRWMRGYHALDVEP